MNYVSRWQRGTIWSSFGICDQSVCFLGPSLHPWRAHESQTAENGDQVQTEAGELCRQKFIIHDEFSFSSSSPSSSLSSQQWSLVCGTSERATAAGINLVRRSAWLQAKEYGATGPRISSHDHVQQTPLPVTIVIKSSTVYVHQWFWSDFVRLWRFPELVSSSPSTPSATSAVHVRLSQRWPSSANFPLNILCHRTRWWGNPSWSSSATRPPTSSSSSFSSLSHSGLRISLGIKIFMVNIIIIRYLGNHCVMRIIRVIEGVRVIMLLGNRHSQRRDYVFVGRRYMWPSGIEEELLLSDSDEKRDPRKNLNIILGK